MKTMRWASLVAFLVLLLVLAACAAQPTAIPSTAGEQPTVPAIPDPAAEQEVALPFAEEDVSHAIALSQMRGHLSVSLPLWEAGNYELAAAHASHPLAELFPIVEDELKAVNADAALRSALDAYLKLAGADGDAAKVKTAHQAVLGAVDAAEQALVGLWVNDARFQGEVIRGLLEGVEEEYAEAVTDGKIGELVEYQDALGFLTAARQHYEAIEAEVKAEHPKEHEEIEEQFIKLEAALPGVTPPAEVVAPDEIEEHIGELVAELSEAVGLEAEATLSPVEIIAAIREKVEGSLEEYKEGKNDEAYELAASAYLNGFEKIEADMVAKGGQELMETLEIQFKDLRDGIKAGKTPADLEQLASEINANLDKAEALLK
ncbi:MAG TPA: hypothetical protein DEP84_03255 [Chloroflexi bacterium]|nr:hypothetical protein [Chloroflexota bacterium]